MKSSGNLRNSVSLRSSLSGSRRGKDMTRSASAGTFRSSLGRSSTNAMNRSFSTDMGKSLNSGKKSMSMSQSVDFSTVENEYIRNLQQQVYFLELETEYLRDQSKKASTVPVRVTDEADKMMKKLRYLQGELDRREEEVGSRESTIRVLEKEKNTTISKLREKEEVFDVEKKELVNEVVQLKKQLERSKLDRLRKEESVEGLRLEADQSLESLRLADSKIDTLKTELADKTEAYNKLLVQYEEKRAECVRVKTEFQELEDRFFRSEATSKEMISRDHKEEIRNLRYTVREKEITAEQDRALRLKISDDCAALVKENAALSSQMSSLQKQLDAERQFKDDKSNRQQANIQQLVTLQEENKQMSQEIERLQENLKNEQDKYRKLLTKLSYEEENHARAKLQRSKLRAELDELEGIESEEAKENIQLRRDKLLLTDEVEDLRKQMYEKDEDIVGLRTRLQDSRSMIQDLESSVRLQTDMETVKWEEFEKMADQMKQFSRHMSPLRKSMMNSSVSLASKSVEFDT